MAPSPVESAMLTDRMSRSPSPSRSTVGNLLEPDKTVAQIDAVTLSGGSAFGLDAASGVVAGMRAQSRGFKVLNFHIPLVPAAIIFDLPNGGDKNWDDNPYPALGRAAFENATEEFAIGTAGAGTGAMTGTLKGGLGSASFVLESGITVGALVAANPVGSVTTPGERHFWAAPFEIDGEFGGLGPDPRTSQGRDFVSRKAAAYAELANTAIAVVATDAALDKAQAKRIAWAAHDGIARATLPSHLPNDGDLVFCVSTCGRQMRAPELEVAAIGHAASLCLARAIARAVYHATPTHWDILPCWTEVNS